MRPAFRGLLHRRGTTRRARPPRKIPRSSSPRHHRSRQADKGCQARLSLERLAPGPGRMITSHAAMITAFNGPVEFLQRPIPAPHPAKPPSRQRRFVQRFPRPGEGQSPWQNACERRLPPRTAAERPRNCHPGSKARPNPAHLKEARALRRRARPQPCHCPVPGSACNGGIAAR